MRNEEKTSPRFPLADNSEGFEIIKFPIKFKDGTKGLYFVLKNNP